MISYITFSRIDRNIKSIIIKNVGFWTSQTKLELLIFFSIIFPLLYIIKPPVSHKQYSNFDTNVNNHQNEEKLLKNKWWLLSSLSNIVMLCLLAFVRRPPEISIEWSDVTIEIKVCAPEIQPEDRSFVKCVNIQTFWVSLGLSFNRYYPELDTSLLCFDDLDAKKSRERKKTDRQKTNPQESVTI